jgi:hypothetical protein
MKMISSILFVLSIPMIAIYRSGGGIDFNFGVASTFGKYSIANLGSDSVKCDMIPHNLGKW